MVVTAVVEPPGWLLQGRYRLDDRIAAGGMGEVWRAGDLVLGRPVAVKLLRPGYAADSEGLARFRAEARHAGSLSHPGIAQVYDYHEADPPYPPYLVMELVDGPSLARLLESGPAGPARTVSLIAQAARALAAAHAAGLVHRDIKPGNLLVNRRGQVKITDFGIARAAAEPSAPLTRPGVLMGTPAYGADGHAGLPGAGTGRGRAGRARGRPVRAGHRGLSLPDRPGPVPRRTPGGGLGAPAAAAAAAAAGGARGGCRAGRRPDRQRPRGTPRQRRRGRRAGRARAGGADRDRRHPAQTARPSPRGPRDGRQAASQATSGQSHHGPHPPAPARPAYHPQACRPRCPGPQRDRRDRRNRLGSDGRARAGPSAGQPAIRNPAARPPRKAPGPPGRARTPQRRLCAQPRQPTRNLIQTTCGADTEPERHTDRYPGADRDAHTDREPGTQRNHHNERDPDDERYSHTDRDLHCEPDAHSRTKHGREPSG